MSFREMTLRNPRLAGADLGIRPAENRANRTPTLQLESLDNVAVFNCIATGFTFCDDAWRHLLDPEIITSC